MADSPDDSQTNVKMLNPEGSDNGSDSDTSGDEDSSDTFPNQQLHQVPSEYLHPATYVNVEPKLYKPDMTKLIISDTCVEINKFGINYIWR